MHGDDTAALASSNERGWFCSKDMERLSTWTASCEGLNTSERLSPDSSTSIDSRHAGGSAGCAGSAALSGPAAVVDMLLIGTPSVAAPPCAQPACSASSPATRRLGAAALSRSAIEDSRTCCQARRTHSADLLYVICEVTAHNAACSVATVTSGWSTGPAAGR